MLQLKKWIWVTAVAAVTAAPAAAQQGTVTSGGGRTTSSYQGTGGLLGGGAGQLGGGGTGGTGGIGGSGTGGGGTGGGGGAGGTGAMGGTELSATPLMQMQRPPQLSAPTGQARGALQSSNFLAGYYANPYTQGMISAQVNATPGGFGMPLYGTTGGAQGGRVGSTALGGGGLAGRGGQFGGGQYGQNGNLSGIVVPLPVQIAYAAEIQFTAPPVAATSIQTDLRGIIDRTTMIANPQNVQIVVTGGNNVTLRGTVKNDDEARLVEGMVRLTPGVGEIRNELTFPTARK